MRPMDFPNQFLTVTEQKPDRDSSVFDRVDATQTEKELQATFVSILLGVLSLQVSF